METFVVELLELVGIPELEITEMELRTQVMRV
jgi:hypothetical protein